jgi:hypothetical protein
VGPSGRRSAARGDARAEGGRRGADARLERKKRRTRFDLKLILFSSRDSSRRKSPHRT